ncbi:hypothetical protein SAMN05216338_104550 [Bradyrhizobium sp. Rc2d]|nr:hypothetical protein SAMN05216338_104550 [Bradyrhizobium sp. Rc2d]
MKPIEEAPQQFVSEAPRFVEAAAGSLVVAKVDEGPTLPVERVGPIRIIKRGLEDDETEVFEAASVPEATLVRNIQQSRERIVGCASNFAPLVQARDVVSAMDANELKEFLAAATYHALFLSCQPSQKSYPSSEHSHGVWTYFLLKALTGQAEAALGPGRYLTATSLQDYLRKEVPNYVTHHLTVKGNQIPRAIIEQSNTFQIRHVPEPKLPIAEAGDLSPVKVTPRDEYLEGREDGKVRMLDGFDKQRHKIFPTVTAKTNEFVRGLLATQIDDEIGGLYREAKKTLKMSARELVMDSGDGDGNLDCSYFRFSIEGQQDPDDASQYVIVRRLELREGWEDREKEIDDLFGSIFDSLVVEIDSRSLKFDALVELFERIESTHGGNLDEDRRSKRIEYAAADGARITIDVGEGRLALSKRNTSSCSELVDIARQYRFTLDGPSRLLLAST